MIRPTLPGGTMTIAKAQQRWKDVRLAANEGDPTKMAEAVSLFEGIVNTIFAYWKDHQE